SDYKDLAVFLPGVSQVHVFQKTEFSGLKGAYRFGSLLAHQQYDLFFSPPDSFSAAFMGWASQAKRRVGFRNEARSFLLTHAYKKPNAHHRVDEYIYLLEQYIGKPVLKTSIKLLHQVAPPAGIIDSTAEYLILLNFNSEAQSRRLPAYKAASILQ